MEEKKLPPPVAASPHFNGPRPINPNWVLSRLKEPETLEKIGSILAQHGLSVTKPSLRLDLEVSAGQPALSLDLEDLKKLFAPFGTVESIVMQNKQKTAALVVYKDIVSAYLAQQTLNNFSLPSYNAKLVLKWSIPENEISMPDLPFPSIGKSFIVTFVVGSAMEGQNPPLEEYKAASYYPPQIYADPQGASKYTCRFDIQIENDKEFQVARKLIGAKGSNMKRIVDQCSKGCACPVQEVIKLRLRGKGSGFKEGPQQQESDEPLHLCISSRYYEKYVMAKQMARDLILDVYEDYRRYCERTGKEPPKLDIKLTENISGNRQRSHVKAPTSRPMPSSSMYYSAFPPSHPASGPAQSYYYESPAITRPANPYYPPQTNYSQYYPQYGPSEISHTRPYMEHYGYNGYHQPE